MRHAATVAVAVVVGAVILLSQREAPQGFETAAVDDNHPTAVTTSEPAVHRPAGQPTPTTPPPNATVVRIIDGDTVEVDIGGQRESVRLIGIDTPEKTGGLRDAECYGDEATRLMQQLLAPGDLVFLERDEEQYDQYDRVLAYVHRSSDGLFVNHRLVLDGAAAAMRFEPNTFHANMFDAAEATARADELGLWGACGGPDRKLTS